MLEPRLTQEELEGLVEQLDEMDVEEHDDDLAAFFEWAWPTKTSQDC